jgi:hypothetical protein
MNEDAGRGGPLIVTVRLQNGKELPMLVDSGTSGTFLDKSLEPELGKTIGQVTLQSWGKHFKKSLYAAPTLYLGNVRLMTGSNITTLDFKQISLAGEHVMGVLGYDTLEHYCIQFDFAAGKVRFFNDEKADKQKWGTAFQIVALNSKDSRPALAENLLGVQGPHSLIDSGYFVSVGWLMPKFYRQWTNQAVPLSNGEAHSPDGCLGGYIYQDVSLDENNVESDGIGLRFLARHMVTMDFPKHTLYLNRTRDWPLHSSDGTAPGKK